MKNSGCADTNMICLNYVYMIINWSHCETWALNEISHILKLLVASLKNSNIQAQTMRKDKIHDLMFRLHDAVTS